VEAEAQGTSEIVSYVASRMAIITPDALQILSGRPDYREIIDEVLSRGVFVVDADLVRDVLARRTSSTSPEPLELHEPQDTGVTDSSESAAPELPSTDNESVVSGSPESDLTENQQPSEEVESAGNEGEGEVWSDAVDNGSAEKEVVVLREGWHPLAKEYDGRIRVFEDFDVTGKSFCEGTVQDFVRYFRDRYERLSAMLKARPHTNLKPLDRMHRYVGEEIDVIAMVYDIRETKSGNLVVELETPDSYGKAIIPKASDPKVAQLAESLLPDDVVLLHGRVSGRGMFIVSDIAWPDVPLDRVPHYSDVPLSVAITSDWHVGSRLHIKKAVERFIKWLRGEIGNERSRELAGRVKYLIVNGDVVDGVGVYPQQIDELEIKDIYKQYDAFAKYLEQIPDYIEVIIGPGNHDAVRRLEPQPALDKDFAAPLYEFDNVTLVGSPAYFSLEGVEFLTYHGTSMDDLISRVPYLSYTEPQYALREYLKHRHLAIQYGLKNPIVPERRDYMVIERVPDVLTSGHVHKNGYGGYRGVSLVVSGTFQDQTPFQLEHGHVPTPGEIPVFDLSNHKLANIRMWVKKDAAN